jgi:hypothetical protein
MSVFTALWLLFAVAAILAQAWITVRVLRSDLYTPLQRRLQVLFVWLVPIIGAAVVYAALRHEEGPGAPEIDAPDDDDEGDVVGDVLDEPVNGTGHDPGSSHGDS